ncbi:MAG: ferric reductase-like transmembrane domain-containing protein [Patescibacteria group bacterium]
MRSFFIFTVIVCAVFVVAPHTLVFAETIVQYDAALPVDTDLDGLTDQGELQTFGTDPRVADTDDDTYLDGAEILIGSDPLDAGDPARYIVSASGEPAQREIPWAWYVARATGLEAYVLLFIVIVMGVGIYTKTIPRIFRSEDVLSLHKGISVSAGILLAVHLVALLLDPFIKFELYEMLVPFTAHFKNTFVGIGVIAFYLFLVILVSSLFFRERFPRQWRKLHYLTYPLFFMGLAHGAMVGTDTAYPAIRILYWVTGSIAGVLMLYRIAYPYLQKRYAMSVATISHATPDIMDLTLEREDKHEFPYFKPGQYTALARYGSNGSIGEKHYFSIASQPNKRKTLRFGIRIFGYFTQDIARMRPGDKLALLGPYGDFVFEPETMRRAVFIAGGVGITPFLSAVEHATENALTNDLVLLYSNKSKTSTAFLNDIQTMAERNPRFTPFFFLTEKKPMPDEPQFLSGRIDEIKLRHCIGNIFADTHFFICGPQPFMGATAKLLKHCGVSPRFIRKEEFYSA